MLRDESARLQIRGRSWMFWKFSIHSSDKKKSAYHHCLPERRDRSKVKQGHLVGSRRRRPPTITSRRGDMTRSKQGQLVKIKETPVVEKKQKFGTKDVGRQGRRLPYWCSSQDVTEINTCGGNLVAYSAAVQFDPFFGMNMKTILL